MNNDGVWAIGPQSPSDPWIMVDCLEQLTVKGIITQGFDIGVSFGPNNIQQNIWVSSLQIQYGDSNQTLVYIMEGDSPKVSFTDLKTMLLLRNKPHHWIYIHYIKVALMSNHHNVTPQQTSLRFVMTCEFMK